MSKHIALMLRQPDYGFGELIRPHLIISENGESKIIGFDTDEEAVQEFNKLKEEQMQQNQ